MSNQSFLIKNKGRTTFGWSAFGLFLVTTFFHAEICRAEVQGKSSVQEISQSANWSSCASVYFEGANSNQVSTLGGLVVPKAGACQKKLGLEFYGTARTGVDTRTFLEKSDAIYNDNYLFAGLGVDYTALIPGVRLSAAVGHSFDLNPKIHLGGFDFRSGFMTYHEKEWVTSRLRNEIYSEGFYVRRYQNFVTALQVRSFLTAWQSSPNNRYQGFEMGPYLNLMGSFDSAGADYNRFMEAQYGARIRYQAPMTFAFHVLGVAGHRSEGEVRNYSDLRLLLTGYWEL